MACRSSGYIGGSTKQILAIDTERGISNHIFGLRLKGGSFFDSSEPGQSFTTNFRHPQAPTDKGRPGTGK